MFSFRLLFKYYSVTVSLRLIGEFESPKVSFRFTGDHWSYRVYLRLRAPYISADKSTVRFLRAVGGEGERFSLEPFVSSVL